MGLRSEIKAVLAIEEDGRRRLEEARNRSEAILRGAREEAEKLDRQALETLGQERAARAAETEIELGGSFEAMEEEERLLKKALKAMADRNREAALSRILSWLRVEP